MCVFLKYSFASNSNFYLCVFYRFFKYELLAKGAITKDDLPIFLSAWLDRSNSLCMFSPKQLRTWSTSHLTGGGWYLDCAPSFTPPFESELRKSREAVAESGVEMIDLQGIEDEHERAKALSRRLEEDRKKSLRVKELEEKAAARDMEKLQRSSEKTTIKGKRKMNPPSELEGKSPPALSPTCDTGSNAPTQSRGTKRDSYYDQLSQGIPVVEALEVHDAQVGEWIKNFSLEQVLGGDTGTLSPLFDDLKLFISKVLSC